MTPPALGKTKHILHVIETMNPASGGPSAAVRTLFEFAPPGYSGEVVTLDDPNSAFLAAYSFPIHALGRGHTRLRYSRQLRHWLRIHQYRFDGVIVSGLWRYVSFASWRTMRKKTPYLVFTHGMLDPYFKRRFPLKHLRKWIYWLLSEYWVLRDAHRVLFTTEEESRLARKSFWLNRWKPLVIPLGATRPEGPEAILRDAFYTRLPELRDRHFLLFLGRLHQKKGCDLLISAFCRLAATDTSLHLVMAGPDQQGWGLDLKKIVLRAGLTHRVHWPGMIEDEVKWGAFFACEAFILPSHQENFGIAVAEALACGRPVLLTDKINIAAEIAGDGAALIEPDTQVGVDRLLERWIDLPALQRTSMSLQAVETFSKRYDMRKNASAIFKVFDQVPRSR